MLGVTPAGIMASSATGSVSGVVRLTDLNDFISPSQSCIKPVEIPKSSKRGGTIAIEADGGYVEVSTTVLPRSNEL